MPDVETKARPPTAEPAGFAALRQPLAAPTIAGSAAETPGYGARAPMRSETKFASVDVSVVVFKQMKSQKGNQNTKASTARLTAENARRRFNQMAMAFDAIDWQVIATIAEERLSKRPQTVARKQNGSKPAFYRTRPRGERLVDFLRREYRDKGYLGGHFSLADLRRYDPACAKAILLYEYRREPLPDDVALPKRAYKQRAP